MEVYRVVKKPKRLAGRITKQQKLRLLDWMKANRSIGRGHHTTRSSSTQNELCWKNVATELNSLSGGKKSPEQWKRCWIDWKAAVKKQYKKIKSSKKKSGNLSYSEQPKPLNKMEEDIIHFFVEDLVDADGAIPEARFSEEETPWDIFPISEGDLADAGPSTWSIDAAAIQPPKEEPSPFKEEPSSNTEEPSCITEDPSQMLDERPTAAPKIELTPKPSLISCFEETKDYVGQQNNAILNELRKMNEHLSNISKDIREMKEKFK